MINPSRIARSPSIQHAEQVDEANHPVGVDVRRARWAAWAPVVQDGQHFLEVHHAIRDEVGDALAFVGYPIGVHILRSSRCDIARITYAIVIAIFKCFTVVRDFVAVAVVVFEFATVKDAVGVAVFSGR